MDEDVDEPRQSNDGGSDVGLAGTLIASYTSSATGHDRWTKLSKLYNDTYLDLFNEAHSQPPAQHNLQDTQYGIVTWSTEEKSKFFEALARKGRHDLEAISAAVETKSIVEVAEYLHLLREAEKERHMFYASVKRASHAEIDAAVEVGPELEDKLEAVADALAAFQDHYDQAAARIKGSGLWLVDAANAQAIDEANDVREEQADDEDEGISCLQFFKFGTMLELSKNLFMNTPPGSHHDHWTDLADGDEPSVTVDAVQDFYNLVKSITMRLLQSALFLAESRIRATTSHEYTPSRALKEIDVEAALDVLGMPNSAFNYLPAYLERSKHTIVVGGHKKGERSAKVSLDEAKRILAMKQSEGRRMSLSRAVSVSSDADRSSESGHSVSASQRTDDELGLSQSSLQSHIASPEVSGADQSEISTVEDDGSEAGDDSDVDMSDQVNKHVSRKRRRRMLELAEDEFMEKLDQIASMREDTEIREKLGWPIMDVNDDVKLGRTPAKLRKMREDLQDWTEFEYRQPWESGLYKTLATDEMPQDNNEGARESAL